MISWPDEPVEFPEHQRVARLNGLQARGQAGAIIASTRSKIFVNAGGIDASGQQRVTLRRQRLGAVRLGYADIADQHRSPAAHQESWRLPCKLTFISATGFLAIFGSDWPHPAWRRPGRSVRPADHARPTPSQ